MVIKKENIRIVKIFSHEDGEDAVAHLIGCLVFAAGDRDELENLELDCINLCELDSFDADDEDETFGVTGGIENNYSYIAEFEIIDLPSVTITHVDEVPQW